MAGVKTAEEGVAGLKTAWYSEALMIDWPAWAFVALVMFGCLILWRESKSQTSAFRVIQFVSGDDGKGNSASLAYVVALLVSTWFVWYQTVNGRGSGELILIYTGVFVAGGVARQGITAMGDRAQGSRTVSSSSSTTTTDTKVPP